MNIEKYIAHIKNRFERTVISGTKVCHAGDCGIYKINIPVCTCGLLHSLLPFAASHYEEVLKLYPEYEKDLKKQEIWEVLTSGSFTDEELKKIFKPLTEGQLSEEEFEKWMDRIFK